jgi:hypothetical protein
VIHHPEFGWLTFGGNQEIKSKWLEIIPLDSSRSRLYLAPKGLWLTLEVGKFNKIRFDRAMEKIQLSLDTRTDYAANALLRIEQPFSAGKNMRFRLRQDYRKERGQYVIPLTHKNTRVELIADKA